MKGIRLVFTLGWLLFMVAGPAPAAAPPRWFCADGETVAVVEGQAVKSWPQGETIVGLPVGATATVACAPQRVAIVVAPTEGKLRIQVFEKADGSWRSLVEFQPRTQVLGIELVGERLVGRYEDRHEGGLFFLDLRHGAALEKRPLPNTGAWAVSADGREVYVASGKEIRTFRVSNGGTWQVFTFPEPVTALATHPGLPWLLVGQGPTLVLVDPADPQVRGQLPIRLASRAWSGTVTWAGWLSADGSLAGVLLDDQLPLIALRGADLQQVAEVGAAGEAAVAVLEDGRLLVGRAGKLDYLALPEAVRIAGVRPVLKPLPPAENTTPDKPVQARAVELPAKHSRSKEKAPPPPKAPAKVEPVPPPPPPPVQLPPPAEPKEKPALPTPEPPIPAPAPQPLKAEPAPAPPPVKAEPAPAPPPVKAEPAPAPPPAAVIEKPAVATPPAPAPAPPNEQPIPPPAPKPAPPAPPPAPAKTEPTSVPPPSVPAPAPSSMAAPPLGAPVEGGGITGTITGRIELVAEVVLIGPNHISRVHSRIQPQRQGAALVFEAKGLPPGRYRVIPMGPKGASLAAVPSIGDVTVSADRGAKIEFKILASW